MDDNVLFEFPKMVLYSDRGIVYANVSIGENSSTYVYI